MKVPNKIKKENVIIDSAEQVFARVGFKNTRMDEIARVAGITKVTLYSYFKSKENLYMAVTYRALQALIDTYNERIGSHNNLTGLEASIALMEGFMTFCEDHYLYSEALLDYFSIVRSTAVPGQEAQKLTEALKESNYFTKVQELQNLPYKISAQEIQRGIHDGSIKPGIDPMFQTLHTWTIVIGYAKVVASSGDSSIPLFSVSLRELKNYNLDLKRRVLENI
jgi:AcrR family transcriptional regulator